MNVTYDTILKDNDPAVREKSAPVKLPMSKKERDTLTAMIDYIRKSRIDEYVDAGYRPAVGLAAPQIGVKKRMFAMSVDMGEDEQEDIVEYCLVNPRIISHSVQNSYLVGGEGCLSVEDEHAGYVQRHARITVRAYDMLQDKEVDVRFVGYLSVVVQHEMDHFDGVLFYDHINLQNPFRPIPNAMKID